MEIGLGHIRLSPREFWAMSLPEWRAAFDGYLESIGAKRTGDDEYMTRAELEELERMVEAHPDG